MASLRRFGSAWRVASPVGQGETLAGKYRVTRVIAEGGMGIVVAARHLKLDQQVALKFMLPELLRSSEATGRFLREARAAVMLQSEHVARILDIGELPTGLPYIVMELLEGSDLGAVIYASAPLSIADAIDYVLQACEAIAEAHGLGIVHRDLKPENLFVTKRRDGAAWIKVLDFGISKVLPGLESRQGGARVTTRESMGSPTYMSPEQMRCTRDVDGRADIWSLGIILYELLTGRQPFTGRSIAEVCLKVTQEPLPPLERADLPEGLAAVVEKCLAKEPEARYLTVADLVRALAPFAPPRSLPSITEVLRGTTARPDDATDTAWPALVRTPVRTTVGGGASRRRRIVGIAGAAAVILAAGLGLLARSGAPTPSAASEAPVLDPPGAPSKAGASASEAPESGPARARGSTELAANDAAAAPAPPVAASKKKGARPQSAAGGPSRPRASGASADGGAPKPPDSDVFSFRK
jgi:eukaryotic-like serine/threonine-protein kinase